MGSASREAYKKQHFLAFSLFLFLALVAFANKFPWAGKELRFINNDFNSYYLNWRYMAEKFQQGIIPHWTPYESLGGQPFIGNGFANLYPLHLIFFLPVILWPLGENALFAFIAEIAFHFVLGGFLAYLFFRRGLKVGFWSALLGGVVFIYNPIFLTFTEAPTHLYSTIWLPLVLYFLSVNAEDGGLRSLYGAGVALGFSFLGGYFYDSLLILLISFMWFMLALWQREKARWRLGLRAVLSFVFLTAIGWGLWAVEFLPQREVVANSLSEAPYTLEGSSRFALSFSELINFVSPFHYLNDGNVYKYFYVSWIGWLLIFFALVKFKLWREKNFLFFLLAAIFFLLLSLGKNTHLHALFYYLVPTYSMFRRPSVALFVCAFAIAALAALAGQKWRLAKVVKISLLVIVFVQLFSLSFKIPDLNLAEGDQRKIFGTNEVLQYLHSRTQDYSRVAFSQALMIRYLAGTHQFSQVGGYQAFPPQRLVTLYRKYDITKDFDEESVFRILQLGGVKYVVTTSKLNHPGYHLELTHVVQPEERFSYSFLTPTKLNRPAQAGETVFVYQVTGALPRAYLVDKVLVKNSEAVADLFTLQLGKQALVESQNLSGTLLGSDGGSEELRYEIKQLEVSDNRVSLVTRASKKALLVLTDAFYPNWQVTVNGQVQNIYLTNYYQRGVVLEPGENRVAFSYQPRWFYRGLVVSALTIAFGLILLGKHFLVNFFCQLILVILCRPS